MEELIKIRFLGLRLAKVVYWKYNIKTQNGKWLVELRARLIEACTKGQSVKFICS